MGRAFIVKSKNRVNVMGSDDTRYKLCVIILLPSSIGATYNPRRTNKPKRS